MIWVGIMMALLLVIGWFFIWRYYAAMTDKRTTALQQDLIARHCEEVRNIYREMRGWRHDYHNHIQTLKAYRHAEENEKIDDYLTKLDVDLTSVDKLIKSGNVSIDAILNSKLSLAASRKITVNAKAIVPAELTVSEVDLSVILGNLLDNAAEACIKLKDEASRFIRFYIVTNRGHLYICVTNASGGRLNRQDGRFITDKPGFHGLGLMRIDRIVTKYGGYIRRAGEEGAFTTEITLPM